MKVAFDVDGVLADFTGAFIRVMRSLGTVIEPGYVPSDWHWSDILNPESEAKGFATLKSQYNFWETLRPFKDGLDAAQEVASNSQNDVYLLTARALSTGETIARQTRAWLHIHGYDYLANNSSVITVAKPGLKKQILEGVGIAAMIDDHGPTIEGFDTIPEFNGYLLNRRWNQDARVKHRADSVREFCERIECLR